MLRLSVLALVVVAGMVPAVAQAATLQVTATTDAVDASAGDGKCATAAGTCTLRAAVQEANASGGENTITVPAGRYALSIAPTSAGSLSDTDPSQGDLDISGTLTIRGAGPARTVIDGGGLDRVFFVDTGAKALLRDMRITHADSTGGGTSQEIDLGGAILNNGDITLERMALVGNLADGGGGMFSIPGTHPIVRDSLIAGNRAYSGGGLRLDAGGTVINTTISGNRLLELPADWPTKKPVGASVLAVDEISGWGGGIDNRGGGDVVIVNSTIVGNHALKGGGGLAAGQGYAPVSEQAALGRMTLRNTIVAANTSKAGPQNCHVKDQVIASLGNNLDTDGSCFLTGAGDKPKTEPLLGPLRAYGGPTRTIALRPGSPALDAGGAKDCPKRDARGVRRPQGRACDIGAFELRVKPKARAAAATETVKITDEKQIKPRVIELTISTPAFAGPTHVHVDLPVGYDSDPRKRWPVTYVLAGTMNTYKTFNSFVDGVKLTEAYPSIVVSPNGDSGYWSDWYNGGAFGPPMYETYVIRQLLPLIDAHFRTIAKRSSRAVFGISMGGYGAMMVAARHPDLFAAAASLSGAVDSNLPANGAVLSASSEFQGADADAIYGPRATQEVRWHGHNPTDLADNLRGLDLQVRTANGTPNPGIGEDPATADSASCIVEGGVHMASVNFHDALDVLKIGHLYKDYGAGCHTKANFTREIADTLQSFAKVLAAPPAPPASFRYASIEPDFDVWGWRVVADPKRALEFLHLAGGRAVGLTVTGSGKTTVTTPARYRGLGRVDVRGGTPAVATPDAAGRVTFTVDLGAPDTDQQYTPGAQTKETKRTVTFAPHAVVRIVGARVTPRRVHVCARSLGGPVTARLRVVRAGTAVAGGATLKLGARRACRSLRRTGRPASGATVIVAGTDRFGHGVRARRKLR